MGLLDFKSSDGQKMSVVGSTPMHFRQLKNEQSTTLKMKALCPLFSVLEKEEIMFGIGMPELLVILVIILIIFGAGKLPQIGEGLGKGIRNFRKSTKDQDEIDVTPKKNEEISEKK